jgi:3-hydroxyisobutyrate dehydrogenase-like beta-hydroxyacid dehydrogenase
MKAGFIGLGSMGAPIARRLARCGFDVTGCDVSPAMLEAFDEPGTQRTADPFEAARGAGLLGICVRTDAQFDAVVEGGQLYAVMSPGGTVILHSTIAPELAMRQAELAASHGIGFVDVGVSGGGPAAIEGQLSLYVGASDADLEKARPWLEAIGKNLAHLGGVGKGQQGKLLNNLISIANYGMSSAIVDIGEDMGFDRQQLIDAFMAGSAQSFALRVGPGFTAPGRDHMDLHDLLRKDVDHCRDLPTGETAARDGLVAACEVMLARLRRAAGAQKRSGREIIEAYVAAVKARDLDAFIGLFADDATYTVPNGKTMTGPAEIREFQAMVFSAGQPSPTPLEWFVAPDGVAVEIEAKLPDGSVRLTTNHYRFDSEGRIVSLRVFART